VQYNIHYTSILSITLYTKAVIDIAAIGWMVMHKECAYVQFLNTS